MCRQRGLLAGKVSALGFQHRIFIVQKRLPRILHCLIGILFLPVNAAIADDCDFGSPDFFESATVASIEDCIQSGQDVNSKGFQGTTPLHWTARSNTNPAVIAALLEAGADINSRDEIFNRTPLYDAVSFNSEPAVISVLLEAGADIHTTSPHTAIMASNPPVAALAPNIPLGADDFRNAIVIAAFGMLILFLFSIVRNLVHNLKLPGIMIPIVVACATIICIVIVCALGYVAWLFIP